MKYKDFKMMSNDEMKGVKGGYVAPGSGGACNTNSDCGRGEACRGLGNLPKVCNAIATGTGCSTNDECGNEQSCVINTSGSPAKWCVYGAS